MTAASLSICRLDNGTRVLPRNRLQSDAHQGKIDRQGGRSMQNSPVTQLIEAAARGEAGASDKLLPLVYEELRKLAHIRMGRDVPGQTLQPTALVHEAYLRLVGGDNDWANRSHFFAAAAETMRRISAEESVSSLYVD